VLPSFIVIGAAKSGTTSLCALLQEHPDVFFTRPKEPHYFQRITDFESRRAWYESLFAGKQGYEAAGEGSTSYSHPNFIKLVVPRLATTVPDCRLIYMVRQPIRRLESDWKMRTLEGRIDKPIAEAVERHVSLLTIGMYWSHLSMYRQYFSDDQILVVFLEDFARNPKPVLKRVFRHIGVDDQFVPDEPTRARNTIEDRQVSTRVERLQQRMPGVRLARRFLPGQLQTIAKSVLLRGVRPAPQPEWNPSALAEVSSLLREDSQELLAHCGKVPDFWKL